MRDLTLAGVFVATLVGSVAGQQEPNTLFAPPIPPPAYAPGAGPRVGIDPTVWLATPFRPIITLAG